MKFAMQDQAVQQGTVWSVIPRGYDRNNKARFTVLVTPTIGGADSPSDPQYNDPLSAIWIQWFDNVAAVLRTTPQFLSVVSDTGQSTKLNIAAPFPEDPSTATQQDKQLLKNRRDLWRDLITIVPPHLQNPSKGPSVAAHSLATGVHSTNSHRPPNPSSSIQRAWKYQHSLMTESKSTLYRDRLSKRPYGIQSKLALPPFPIKGNPVYNGTSLHTFQKDNAADLANAKLYRHDTNDSPDPIDNGLRTEVSTWLAAAPSSDAEKLAMRTLKRDLGRLVPYDQGKPNEPPPPSALDQAFNTLKSSVICYLYSTRRTQVTPGWTLPHTFDALIADGNAKAPFIKALVFHRRIQPADGVPKTGPHAAPALVSTTPLVYGDFLKALATLQHYPSLLCCFGLAFEATADTVPWQADAKWLQVALDAGAAAKLGPFGAQPKTMIVGRMYPADKTPPDDFPVSHGYLETAQYEVLTYDFDVDTLRRHVHAENPIKPSAPTIGGLVDDVYDSVVSSLLPLKSGGITVARKISGSGPPVTHADLLLKRIKSQTNLRAQTGGAVELYAQDFIRGFSMEILDDSAQPISLTSRNENFFYFPGGTDSRPLLPAPQERLYTPVSSEAGFADDVPLDAPHGDQPVGDPHIGSRICGTWEGWSMAVQSPLQSIQSPTEATAKTDPTPTFNGYPIKPAYTLPKSPKSPRLRYGGPGNRDVPACYKIRIRAVDVMGEGIALPPGSAPDGNDTTYTLKSTYIRHNPVLAPEVMIDEDFDPAAGNYGEHIGTIAVRDDNSGRTSSRYFVPQSARVVDLIDQGAFDQDDPTASLRSPFEIGTFADIKLDSCGKIPSRPLTTGVGADAKPVKFPLYQMPSPPHPQDGTYLPDTYAKNLSIQIRDLATGLHFGPIDMRSFYLVPAKDGSVDETRAWPEAQHIRVQLVAASFGDTNLYASWTPVEVIGPIKHYVWQLNIYIPNGWQVEMLVSCAPDIKQAKRMACDNEGNVIDEGVDLIANGQSTLQTPPRSINLVHAVAQPLTESCFDETHMPAIAPLTLDSSSADISGLIRVGDHRSTALCIVVMHWDEYVDDPRQERPQLIPHTESLVQIHNDSIEKWSGDLSQGIPEHLAHDLPIPTTTYKFANGVYRSLAFAVNAVSRYQPFFVPSVNAPGTPPEDSPYVRPKKGEARVSPTIPLPKLNTCLPADVSLSHILPLLPSVCDAHAPKSGYRVYGGAFRIHMKRGWYSTGQGEQLAIVLVGERWTTCGNTAWEADSVLSTLFTRWGLDPMFDLSIDPASFPAAPLASSLKPPSGLNGFSNPTNVSIYHSTDPTPITIPGVASIAPFDDAVIAAYTPVFTPEDGWYVDVIVDKVPAYNTFVRLALARYQPNSIAGRAMSHVTLAPFIQLRPDRAFRIVRGTIRHRFELGIYGTPTALTNGQKATGFTIVVEVHQSGHWVADPDTTVCSITGSPASLPSTWEGDSPLPLQVAYTLTVAKHHHQQRRVRVNESEMRTGYIPGTLEDAPAEPFWVSFGEPMEFPR